MDEKLRTPPDGVFVKMTRSTPSSVHIIHGMKLTNFLMYFTLFICCIWGFISVVKYLSTSVVDSPVLGLLLPVLMILSVVGFLYFGKIAFDAMVGSTTIDFCDNFLRIKHTILFYNKVTDIDKSSIQRVEIVKNEFIPTCSDDAGHDTWEVIVIANDKKTSVMQRDTEDIPLWVSELLANHYNKPLEHIIK